MTNQGLHHLGLATHNMEATIDFYERVLGFTLRVCDIISPDAGGTIRHAFLDVGQGEMVAFMECNGVPDIAEDFDTGINKGLGSGGVMHFAFAASDEEDLQAKRDALREKKIEVTEVVDHGWCKSIYFRDPNNLQLEFCTTTEEFDDSHLKDRDSDAWQKLKRG